MAGVTDSLPFDILPTLPGESECVVGYNQPIPPDILAGQTPTEQDIDQIATNLINRGIFNAYADYMDAHIKEYIRAALIGTAIYFTIKGDQDIINGLVSDIEYKLKQTPKFAPIPTPAYRQAVTLRFIPTGLRANYRTEEECAMNFAQGWCRYISEHLSADGKASVGAGICFWLKSPAAEQQLKTQLVDKWNDSDAAVACTVYMKMSADCPKMASLCAPTGSGWSVGRIN